MGEVKQINIKSGTYYFYNDMINLKDFELCLLKIDKKHYKGINIYYIGYITIEKLMIMKILTMKTLCICRLIKQTDILREKKEINT